MDPSAPLSKSQSPVKLDDIAKMRNIPYREAVGSLMYAAMGTRPDIAFATSTVAQYSDNPGWKYWEAVKKIFHYLSGMKDWRLVYGGMAEAWWGTLMQMGHPKTTGEPPQAMFLWWTEGLYPGLLRSRN